MLAHLRVGTREGDIHQCCLLSNSNVFSPLICSEASAKTVSRKRLSSNLFSSELVRLSGCLLIHCYILECMIWAFITNQLVCCVQDWRIEDQLRVTTVLAFSSHYLMTSLHGPHHLLQCQATPSFTSFSLSLCSLCHFLALCL